MIHFRFSSRMQVFTQLFTLFNSQIALTGSSFYAWVTDAFQNQSYILFSISLCSKGKLRHYISNLFQNLRIISVWISHRGWSVLPRLSPSHLCFLYIHLRANFNFKKISSNQRFWIDFKGFSAKILSFIA